MLLVFIQRLNKDRKRKILLVFNGFQSGLISVEVTFDPAVQTDGERVGLRVSSRVKPTFIMSVRVEGQG